MVSILRASLTNTILEMVVWQNQKLQVSQNASQGYYTLGNQHVKTCKNFPTYLTLRFIGKSTLMLFTW